ncbi:MAG: flavorubredoxin [bacterium]|jgi:flavorubredoxin
MKNTTTIFENGSHKWVVLHGDQNRPSHIIDSNEYIISHRDDVLLLDPGGIGIFPSVFATLNEIVSIDKVNKIFASHQDPDIISSLDLWTQVIPNLELYASALWETYLPHLGGTNLHYNPIPDEGMHIDLNGIKLTAVPAHFMHSCANFHLYDEEAKILFSGDTGATIEASPVNQIFVDNFQEHTQKMELFHTRWFPSNTHKNQWCEEVTHLKIDMLCPQHGMIFRGDDVKRFIDWLYHLKVGILVK